MGKRGPRPQPTIIKIAKGNPGKRPLNHAEPKPAANAVEPPLWVSGKSLEKWQEVAPKLLAMGVLTNADVETLARYCTMHEQFVKYLDEVRQGGDVLVVRDEAGKVKYMQSTPASTMLMKLAMLLMFSILAQLSSLLMLLHLLVLHMPLLFQHMPLPLLFQLMGLPQLLDQLSFLKCPF